MTVAGTPWVVIRMISRSNGRTANEYTIVRAKGVLPSATIGNREILEDRHGRRSTLITSQLPTQHWHDILGDPTLADAILDRLVHNAHKINLKGDSMRKNKSMTKKKNPD